MVVDPKEEEKRKKRAERFGLSSNLNMDASRAARLGLPVRTEEETAKLQARAARFNITAGGTVVSAEEEEKRKKRQQRFGGSA